MQKIARAASGTLLRRAPKLLSVSTGGRACMILALLTFAGCVDANQWTGPLTRAPISFGAWEFDGRPARVLRTPNYEIHTTIRDNDFLDKLAQVMEAAQQQYRQTAPEVRPDDRPLQCYVFANRAEWAQFTAQNTGSDSAVYLRINRGGYTIRDWYVAYFIGDVGTFAVAAHEGWHQYAARHFRTRLPPFLEEGLATMFENIRWQNELPRWNRSNNLARAAQLRDAVRTNSLWSLETLITMHAGDVVGLPGEKIEAFYAEDWAFAKFLWESQSGKYRPALQKLLADCASGAVYQPPHGHFTPVGGWRPSAVKPMLEHYLGTPFDQIDREFGEYIRRADL